MVLFKSVSLLLSVVVATVHAAEVSLGDVKIDYKAISSGTYSSGINTIYSGDGHRIAVKEQWDAVIANSDAPTVLGSGASPLEPSPERRRDVQTSKGIFWNPAIPAFQYYTLSSTGSVTGGPFTIEDLTQTVGADEGFIVQTTSIACDSSHSKPVNVLDYYGTLATVADTVVDACMCASQYSGSTCSDFTTATSCADVTTVQNTTNTGQQLIRNGQDGGTINNIAESVEFIIDSPQVATRVYTSFQWGMYYVVTLR